ncbi:hypothetical protein [Archangium lipolyticum]|uniref:hypothetical protein n=1 Tax=Archangium lipolyticum TaxID=2970465 RepID=UPI00214A0D43|nr:hypothetical protein [Archangium lipolyticum]
MATPQNKGSANFYQNYNGGIGLENIDIAFAKKHKANFKKYITNIKVTNNPGIGLSQTYVTKLQDMLDAEHGGFGGKKQLTATARKLIEATSNSADLITKISQGENVATNAGRAVLDIGGTLLGTIVPPPYGEALTALLGLVSTFLGITIEERESSLKDEIAELLRDFAYTDLQAQYATKLAQIKQLSTIISENIRLNDLPNRTSTTMEYAAAFVSDKFETTLISWANSKPFKDSSFYDNGYWKNKSVALGRARIMNLTYEYICAKKCLLQGLICLLELTKDQMQKANMGPNKLTPIDEHLHHAQTAYKDLDGSLKSLVNDVFSKSATLKTAVMYAALHAMPSFAHMRTAYRQLTGAAAKYPQPNDINVLTRIVNRGKVPTDFGAKTIGQPGIKFRLRPDPTYPGCFRLVGEANIPWRESSASGLEPIPAAGPFDQDRARFIFIGVTEKEAGTWFLITTRSTVMKSSSELLTYCSGTGLEVNAAGSTALHVLINHDAAGRGEESHYTVRKA